MPSLVCLKYIVHILPDAQFKLSEYIVWNVNVFDNKFSVFKPVSLSSPNICTYVLQESVLHVVGKTMLGH